MSDQLSLVLNQISKKFFTKTIFRTKSLKASKGDLIILKGRNGSGKTTLLKIIAGVLDQTEGVISYNGRTQKQLGRSYFSNLSALLGNNLSLFPYLTCIDNFKAHLALFGHTKKDIQSSMKRISSLFTKDQWETPAYHASSGMNQKISVAKTIMVKRPILLLDEPFRNMDQESQSFFKELLSETAENRITVVSDHQNLVGGTIWQFTEGYVHES